MGKTTIEWATDVWNPVTGCTKVSQGCKNCYAQALHDMRHKAYQAGKKLPAQYAVPFETVQLHPERLEDPLHWRSPRRVFVNSMSDLFHKDVPEEFISQVFGTMQRCPQHTFMILTKRPDRMSRILNWTTRYGNPGILFNVWLGVSVEDQDAADKRIPYLLQTPAAVRFLSCEPLLGELDLTMIRDYSGTLDSTGANMCDALNGRTYWSNGDPECSCKKLDWVIAGGESGPGARPMHPDWARSLRDQCVTANVPFFFKQWGEWKEVRTVSQETVERFSQDVVAYPNGDLFFRVGKKVSGRLLDGRTWDEFPQEAR